MMEGTGSWRLVLCLRVDFDTEIYKNEFTSQESKIGREKKAYFYGKNCIRPKDFFCFFLKVSFSFDQVEVDLKHALRMADSKVQKGGH